MVFNLQYVSKAIRATKSINKAQAEYLFMLARSLCCEIEDLLEKVE